MKDVRTEKLYDLDAYQVCFEAKVQEVETTKYGLNLILDRTLFFPEEGGQNCDTGILSFEGKDYKVEYVSLEKRDGFEVICHRIKDTDEVFHIGDVVQGRIDWKDRYDKMQNHSGEHILSGIIHREFGFDNVGFHLNREVFTMDFNGILSKEQLKFLEEKANEVVMENVAIYGEYVPDEELLTLSYRSKKEIDGAVRIVTIEGYDKCACCAPHVKRSIEVLMIKIIKAENWKGGMRLTVLCGNRAYRDYEKKHEIVQNLSRNFSASEERIVEMVQNLKDEVSDMQYQMGCLESRMALEKLRQKPIQFFDDISQKALTKALDEMMKEKPEEIFMAFCGTDEKGYRYIIGSSEKDVAEIVLQLKNGLNAKGGGKGKILQGLVPCQKSQIEALFL